jgi:protein-tyrosine phosphatase
MAMENGIYWVNGPWKGRLGVAARPRGGDWLDQEFAKWQRENINTVVSLLTPEEETELSLEQEAADAKRHGMQFISIPVQDRQVPDSERTIEVLIHQLDATLSAGRNVLVHCRQGVGRSGLVAACLLINRGSTADEAVEELSKVRKAQVPETAEQRRWIDRYASRVIIH